MAMRNATPADVLAVVCGLSLLLGTAGFTPAGLVAGRYLPLARVPAAVHLRPHVNVRAGKLLLAAAAGNDLGGGGSGGAGGGGGGGGGGGDGGAEDEDNVPYTAVLAKAGKDAKDIPADLLKALEDGKIGASALRKLWTLEAGPMAPFLALAPVRDRLLADPTFVNKIVIDMVVGGIAQGIAEFQVRKDKFMAEIDFVCAGVVTVLLGNCAAVFYAAPTVVPKALSQSSNSLVQFFSQCPDNSFQRLVAGQKPFTNLQRVGAILKPMPQLFTVGFCAAAGGYLYTKLSMAIRDMGNAKKGGETKGGTITYETIAKISVAVGVYSAISTNMRYQLVSGVIEGRLIDKFLANSFALQSAASTLVRTGNTYIGSVFIVEYLRFLKIQKVD